MSWAPPLSLPHDFNAADYFVDRNLREGHGGNTAIECGDLKVTYGQLCTRVNRLGNGLKSLGVRIEERVLLLLLDTPEFAISFFGAIKIGAVPVPVNTLLKPSDYEYLLNNSRARVAIVTDSLLPLLQAIPRKDLRHLETVVVVGGTVADTLCFDELVRDQATALEAAPTRKDDAAFWLYSSGSTGRPKACVHLQHDMVVSTERYAKGILSISESDRLFSVAKLFFAYGLGNSLTFPLSVGARCVLESGRVTPQAVWRLLRDHGVTVFFGVPTLFAALLGDAGFPEPWDLPLRLCVSAGEPLPAEISRAWTARTGVEIVDGIGSTEMLHIFVSNRPGAITHGATGHPVPEYQARIVSEDGAEVRPGDLGELLVQGPSAALGYWNNPAKTAETFVDGWVRTGDQFYQDGEGRFVCCGRTDDMLKVSGIWVSPAEVENVLIEHDAVQEAAVIGAVDGHGLMKTKAFIVLRPGATPTADLGAELQAYAKARLAPHKYPRQIEFVSHLPRTATGKVRRHVLRETPAAL